MKFPIWTTVEKKRVKLRGPKDLFKHYDQIFTPTFRLIIEKSVPRLMFARDIGVMFTDRGEVWLDDKGRVDAFNN